MMRQKGPWLFPKQEVDERKSAQHDDGNPRVQNQLGIDRLINVTGVRSSSENLQPSPTSLIVKGTVEAARAR